MRPDGHRVVSFAGQLVGVEWSGGGARIAAELAFGAHGNGNGQLPDIFFRLGARDDSENFTLFDGRRCLYRGSSPGTTTHLLLQAVLDRLICTSTDGLVIHSALLARGDHGVLLPGPTGCGKTMLCAWLTLHGLDCLSDEACYLADCASQIEGFHRPFCFKGPWVECLGLEHLDRSRVLSDDGVSLVPIDLFKTPSDRASIVPRLIVFPRFSANASYELMPLTPARAAVRLMETIANGRNLPEHGLRQVTDLVRSLDTYGLTYGSFEQLGPLTKMIDALG